MARQRPRPVKLSEALAHLPEEQRRAVLSEHAKQRFRNALRAITGGKPVVPRKIPKIARISARAALKGFSFSPLREKPKRNVISASRYPATKDLDRFNLELMKHFPVSRVMVMPSGYRVRLVAELGPPLLGFEHLQKPWTRKNNFPGEVVRIDVMPIVQKREDPLIYRTVRGNGFEGFLGLNKSRGFAAVKFHRLKGSRKPVMVVWTVESHAFFGLPESFSRRYHNWELGLMAFLEAVARSAGCEKIAVISPGHIDHMVQMVPMNYKNVKQYYERLKVKLEKEGYSELELKIEPLAVKRLVFDYGQCTKRTFKYPMPKELGSVPFLVKNLND